MPYTEITGASGTITGTGGNSNFSHATTTDGEMKYYPYPPINDGYWIGDGNDTIETHSHDFSQEVGGAQINFVGTNEDEEFTISLDGQLIDLNTAIANGDVTFNGGGDYVVNAAGEITLAAGGNPGNLGSLTINVPFTSLEVVHTGADGGGTAYGLLVETDPPAAVCFVAGTYILTTKGEVLIEDLNIGDEIITLDSGVQPIRWVGSSQRYVSKALAPIRIRKGTLGATKDLRVSPQHRMLISGWQAELLFGAVSVLSTAKSLVNDLTIIQEEAGQVEYFHILFDTHEIIFANGVQSESFHPGEQGWRALNKATRDEILEIFPSLAQNTFTDYGPCAYPAVLHKESALLAI